MIKQTEGPRKLSSSVIHEGDWTTSGKGRYTRSRRSADWSDADTVRFYRALAAVGTDFSMMAPLFPNRARRELKIKVCCILLRNKTTLLFLPLQFLLPVLGCPAEDKSYSYSLWYWRLPNKFFFIKKNHRYIWYVLDLVSKKLYSW